MIDKATSEALVQATEQVESEEKQKEDARLKKEKEEADRKFELEKIRVKAEADAKIKYEVEMKHKEDFESKLLAQKKQQNEEWLKVASVAKQKAEVEMKTK